MSPSYCLLCKRVITSKIAIKHGYGSYCWEKVKGTLEQYPDFKGHVNLQRQMKRNKYKSRNYKRDPKTQASLDLFLNTIYIVKNEGRNE